MAHIQGHVDPQQQLGAAGFDIQRMIADGIDPAAFLAEMNNRGGAAQGQPVGQGGSLQGAGGVQQGFGIQQGLPQPSNLNAQGLLPGQQMQTQATGFAASGIPPTGLIGSEQAIQQGLGAQLGLIGQGVGSAQREIDLSTGQARQDINRGSGQASQVLAPFVRGGARASQLQAAQSGALGPEAQRQAFQNFQNSPGQQFAIDQGQQAVLRNAAATQGIGGGNVLRELNRQGIGQAQQNFQQQFQNLGQVAGSGQQAAGLQAGIVGQRGQNLANISQTGGQNLANFGFQGGQLASNAVGGAAGQVAQGRFGVGQQLAQAAQGISTGQANLQNQLGGGLANQFGQGSTNLANLTSGAGQQSAQLTQNLATILANIGTGAGSQSAGFTQAAAQFDASGILGQNTAVQNTLSQLLQLIPKPDKSKSNDTSGPAIQDLIDIGL